MAGVDEQGIVTSGQLYTIAQAGAWLKTFMFPAAVSADRSNKPAGFVAAAFCPFTGGFTDVCL